MRSTTIAARRSLRHEKPHDGREGRASYVCSDAHVLHKMELIEKRSIIYLPKRHTILGWKKRKLYELFWSIAAQSFFSDLPFGPQRSKRIQWLRRIRGSEGGTKNMRARLTRIFPVRTEWQIQSEKWRRAQASFPHICNHPSRSTAYF